MRMKETSKVYAMKILSKFEMVRMTRALYTYSTCI